MELKPAVTKIIDLQHNRVRRLAHRARHTQTYWQHKKTWLITLTYKKEVEEQKEHWSQAMQRFNKWYRGIHGEQAKLLWVRELHKSGRLHYHAVVNGGYPGKWDKLGIWPHGMSQTKPGKGDCASAYLLKYASKLSSKLTGNFKHWRLYGFVGLNQSERKNISYQLMPSWVRETYQLDAVKSPCSRDLISGQRLYSGWVRGGNRGLPNGFDSMIYLGYCPLLASVHYNTPPDGRERSAPSGVGLVT